MQFNLVSISAKEVCPAGAVFIGHGSRWQNPFEGYGEESEEAFHDWFYGESYSAQRFRTAVWKKLQGRQLACDCGDHDHCHAKIILEYLEGSQCSILNAGEPRTH